MPDADARLTDLERRVSALEEAAAVPSAVPEATGAGIVRYSGEVALHGQIGWTIEYDAGAALALDDEPRTAVLAALGHPVRVRIVRSLLRGPRGTAELTEAAELASTGQLYHHLKALSHAGLVEQDGRGSYRVAPRSVVPALVLLTAAADVAGQLGHLS
ncbi:ArsR/SmtB family transcription factor [Pseudonocardia sp. HH130630-07]|uniref:ArsR/SmtB family transcription factor n=1 Tax=Pseudonocardia sp. HH130630-07 TaxID=1690815 RepID=UPI0008153E95|nr:winged helix-turn-helix domain-containing protein [Pseudonocardia sp. HH130630-07]ANY05200.1 ArsR family transcriptional regulator [Pseudonocardia sp. HH130630-07]